MLLEIPAKYMLTGGNCSTDDTDILKDSMEHWGFVIAVFRSPFPSAANAGSEIKDHVDPELMKPKPFAVYRLLERYQ